jgi:magnesium-transporting ATPase (P-type)
MSDNTKRILNLTACANSNANPKITVHGHKIEFEQIGNKTECAILEMIYKLGTDYRKSRDKNKIVKNFPFSSARKKMTTLYTEGKTTYVCCKGAPDFLLEKCSKYIDRNGKPAALTPQFE